MTSVTLELSQAEEAELREGAERMGTSLDALATEALRGALAKLSAFPVYTGRVNVPPDFDWTRTASWLELAERYEAEERTGNLEARADE